MAATADSGSLLSMLPARYSKFIAVLIGLAITYLTIYGTTWHLDPALIMIGTALGVVGVPNGPPPAIPVPVPVPVPAQPPAELPAGDGQGTAGAG
jgi:hypothetical protein